MIAKIEVGTVLATCLAERLLSISAGRYDELIQQTRRSPLEYETAVLLDHHVDKHLDEFDDLTGAAGYQREARRVVRESNRILAHIFEGKGIQLRDWKSKYGPGGVDSVFLYLAELDRRRMLISGKRCARPWRPTRRFTIQACNAIFAMKSWRGTDSGGGSVQLDARSHDGIEGMPRHVTSCRNVTF
jgi:hypothetical protein